MKNDVNTLIINSCNNCPFKYSDYDDFAVGFDTLEICSLAQNNGADKYIIDMMNTPIDDGYLLTTPGWCPLKKAAILFKYEE